MNKITLGKSGLEVSHIGLGTVELGVPGYGIGKKEFISEADALYLLQAAVDIGVTYIDTARGYGLAEERIGKSKVGTKKGVIVGTKCGQFLREAPTMHGVELEKNIRADVDESRRLLGYTTLPLVQLHIELSDFTNLEELIEIMKALQDEGKVDHVGIASRGFDVPRVAIASKFFETIQVAYSILDQRMDQQQFDVDGGNNASNGKESVFSFAEKNNVGVINRSVFLQGALTPARQSLPPSLAPLQTQANLAADIAKQIGIDLPTLAIRFSLSNPAVHTALIGTTKLERIKHALEAAEDGPLPKEIMDQLGLIGLTDPAQVDPSQWQK